MDGRAELLRLGATPVLSGHGLRREAHNYWLRTGDRDLLVVSFDNARTAQKQAAEITVGCYPRYHLERVKRGVRNPHRIPHASMAMFWWRIDAPAEACAAAVGGEPVKTWWTLGEQTPQTARALARTLETEVAELLSFQDAARQYKAVEAVPPDPDSYLHQPKRAWGRVLVRLGREPRPEVERLLAQIPLDQHSARFKRWAYETLDGIYPR